MCMAHAKAFKVFQGIFLRQLFLCELTNAKNEEQLAVSDP